MGEDGQDLSTMPGLRQLAALLIWVLLAVHNLPSHALLDVRQATQVQMRGVDFVIAAGRSELPCRMGDADKAPPPHRPVAKAIRSPDLALAAVPVRPRKDTVPGNWTFRHPPVRGPPAA